MVERLEERQLLSAQVLASAGIAKPTYIIEGKLSSPPKSSPNNSPSDLSAPYTPAEMQAAYGVNLISFGGVTGNGAGQTIAIVDAYNAPDIMSDAATFNSTYGLQQFNVTGGPTLKVLNQNGQASPLPVARGDGQEWDLEESLDVEWAHSIAPEANIILFESTTSNDPDMDQAVETAAATAGVSEISMSWGEGEFSGQTSEDPTFLTPVGHQGVTFLASTGDTGTPAGYPAFSPYVVAVGGTSLYIQNSGTYDYETPWDNGTGADGGGISQVESQPAYQVGKVNGASSTYRTVPDVSMDADPYTGVPVLDSYAGGWIQVGGTSLSSPMMAGIMAIANQGRAINGLGTLNGLTQTLPTLYSLPGSDFHDITTGSNGTYPATVGYDLATGIGTPIANMLVPALATTTVNWAPTLSGPASASVNENTTLNFTGANAITATDQIAGANNIDTLTLSVNDGTLGFGTTTGLTFTSGTNGATESLTVTGTISNISSDLGTLTYTPLTNFSGADQLTGTLSDSFANDSASISVPLAVNVLVPPTLTGPTSVTGYENTTLSFSGANTLSLADAAAGTGSDTLALSVYDGKLAFGTTTGLSGYTVPSSVVTVTGSVTNLAAALASLTYTPINGFSGTDGLSLTLTDPTDHLSGNHSVTLTINSIGVPAITAPTNVSVIGNDPYTFSGSNALSFTDGSAGANSDSVSLSVADGGLTLGSTTGLTITGLGNGQPSMTVTGSVTNLNAALAGLIYSPNEGYAGFDSLSLSVSDPGDGQGASKSVGITVNAPSPPKVTAPSSVAFIGTSYVFSGANAVSVADVSVGNSTDSLSLSVSNGKLTLGSTSGLTFTTGGNNAASMVFSGTLANLNAALVNLTYNANNGFTGGDTLNVAITDPGDSQRAAASVNLTVNGNSPPTINAPTSAQVNTNSSLLFSGANTITVADPSIGTNQDTLQLTVSHGNLSLSPMTGLTITAGANNSPTITVKGTLTNLNAALNGLTYTPTTNYAGGDSLVLNLSDTADGLSAPKTVALTVGTANPQSISYPATFMVVENYSGLFSGSNAISVSDPQAGSGVQHVTLSATHGTVTLGSTSGISVISGSNPSALMTIGGTLTSLNAALNNLVYTPTANYSGQATLTISYTDLGDGQTTTATVAITVKYIPSKLQASTAPSSSPIGGTLTPTPSPSSTSTAVQSPTTQPAATSGSSSTVVNSVEQPAVTSSSATADDDAVFAEIGSGLPLLLEI